MTTLEAPSALDQMLAEIDAGAEPVKKNSKKAPVPFFRVTAIEKLCHELPMKMARLKDLEAEVKADKKDIIDAAKPIHLEACRKAGLHIGTIAMNSLQVQCRKFHFTKKIVDKARIHVIARAWGDRFQAHWHIGRMIVETPEVLAALKATGTPYHCYIAPTGALHEAMSYDEEIRTMMSAMATDMEPIWAVVAGKE